MPTELKWTYTYNGGTVSYEQVPVYRPNPMTDKEIDEMINGLKMLVNMPYMLIKKAISWCY